MSQRNANFLAKKLRGTLLLLTLFALGIDQSESYNQETFDIATFTPPSGWQRQGGGRKPLVFQLSNGNGGGCIITLFPSETGSADAKANFSFAWRKLAATGLAPPQEPRVDTNQRRNGWTVVGANSMTRIANARAEIALFTTTGFGRFMSVMLVASGLNCRSDATNFVASLSFNASPDDQTQVASNQAPTDSAAPWSSLSTGAPGQTPPSAALGADDNMTHTLRYTPPQNAFQAGADDYSFNGINGSLRVYQFRSYSGDIQQQFQTTLMKDWIDPIHREENLGGRPTFQKLNVPGAQVAIAANFAENIVGLPRPHLRVLVVAGREAAILDASSNRVQSWQQAMPIINAVISSLQVEAVRGPPPLSQGAGSSLAGLYMGTKVKYVATMMNITGHADYTPALHFYLFSPDGRVYRAYDKLSVPGGDIRRFDFDNASRTDPINSGRYTVDGDKLIVRMMGSQPESITTDVPRDGMVTINSVRYKRQ
jgi:hypothetical protein